MRRRAALRTMQGERPALGRRRSGHHIPAATAAAITPPPDTCTRALMAHATPQYRIDVPSPTGSNHQAPRLSRNSREARGPDRNPEGLSFRLDTRCAYRRAGTHARHATAHRGFGKQKSARKGACLLDILAERAGFEPASGYYPEHAFQACDLNRSSTSPCEARIIANPVRNETLSFCPAWCRSSPRLVSRFRSPASACSDSACSRRGPGRILAGAASAGSRVRW